MLKKIIIAVIVMMTLTGCVETHTTTRVKDGDDWVVVDRT